MVSNDPVHPQHEPALSTSNPGDALGLGFRLKRELLTSSPQEADDNQADIRYMPQPTFRRKRDTKCDL